MNFQDMLLLGGRLMILTTVLWLFTFAFSARPRLQVLFIRGGLVLTALAAIVSATDFWRPRPAVMMPSVNEFTIAVTPLPEYKVRDDVFTATSMGYTESAPQLNEHEITMYTGFIAFVLFCRVHLGMINVLLRTRRGVPHTADPLVTAQCLEMGVRVPRIVTDARSSTPFVAWFGQPIVFLPTVEIPAVAIRHELIHVKNRDVQWLIFCRMVTAWLWPIFPLHLLAKKMVHASEVVADLEAMNNLVSPSDYAKMLLSYQGSKPKAAWLSVGIFNRKSGLKARVKSVLTRDPIRATRTPKWLKWSATFGITILAVGSIAMLGAPGSKLEEYPKEIPYVAGKRINVVGPDGKPRVVKRAIIQYRETNKLKGNVEIEIASGKTYIISPTDPNPRSSLTAWVETTNGEYGVSTIWAKSLVASTIKVERPYKHRVELKDEEGNAISNLDVEIFSITNVSNTRDGVSFGHLVTPTFFPKVKTDKNGVGIFNWFPKNWQINFQHNRSSLAMMSMTASQEQSKGLTRIRIERPCTLKGRVLFEGKPVAGAEISYQSVKDGAYWVTAKTDSNGRFAIERVGTARGVVSVASPYPFTVAAWIVKPEPEKEQTHEFMCTPGALIKGMVSGIREDWKGKVRVGVYGPARPDIAPGVFSTQVDDQGNYRLRVSPGSNRIFIMAGSTDLAKTVIAEEGKEYTVDFKL